MDACCKETFKIFNFCSYLRHVMLASDWDAGRVGEFSIHYCITVQG